MTEDSPPTVSDLARPGLPGEERIDTRRIPEAYWRAFSIAAFTMNRFIVDQTIRASRQFDNDIEAMVLFGVLAHLNIAHLMPPGTRPSQALNADGRLPDAQPKLRPLRLRDLCQVTGRPRETIRRKLVRLEAQGRVKRVAGGYVYDLHSVDEPMRQLAADGVRRFLAAAEQITAALRDAERALKRQSR
jgi:hypothetical protein